MPEALFVGGPCDGTTRNITNVPGIGESITCQGTAYTYQLDTRSPLILLAVNHVWVSLHGGPCDGEQRGVTEAVFKRGQLQCQGHLYIEASGAKGVGSAGQAVWWDAKVLEDSTVTSSSPAHVSKAWSRWMHVLAHTGPSSHNRIRKATARINRVAR